MMKQHSAAANQQSQVQKKADTKQNLASPDDLLADLPAGQQVIGDQEAQAKLLGETRLPAARRQSLVKRIEQTQGNRHFNTLVTNLRSSGIGSGQPLLQRGPGGGSGGTGGGAGPAQVNASEVQMKAAQEIISDAYGGAIQKTATLVELPDDEFYKEHDRAKIALGAKHSSAKEGCWEADDPWKEGDTQKSGDHIFAFFYDGKVYLPTSSGEETLQDNRVATLAHELLHANCNGDFNTNMLPMYVEGATEALALEAIKRSKSKFAPTMQKYKNIMGDFNAFMNAVGGIDVIQQAYFGGSQIAINAFDANMGAGAYQALKECYLAGRAEDYNSLLTRKVRARWMETQNVKIRLVLKNQFWITESDVAQVGALWSQMLPGEKEASRPEVRGVIDREVYRDTPKNALYAIISS